MRYLPKTGSNIFRFIITRKDTVAESLTLPRKGALRYDPESGSLFGLRVIIDSSNACAVEEVGAQADRPSGEVAA